MRCFDCKNFFWEQTEDKLVFCVGNPSRVLLSAEKSLESTRNNMKRHHKPHDSEHYSPMDILLEK